MKSGNTVMRFIPLMVLAFVFFTPLPGHAESGAWQRDADVGVRLISGVRGVGHERSVPLGLEVELAPEWHTYWRSPGAAGLPPQIDWQNSQTDQGNLQSASILYPAPQRYTAYGLETVGYREHVVFPIDAEVRVPGQPLVLDASVSLLVCSAICVPKTFSLQLTVPDGDALDSDDAPLLHQARDQLPGDAERSGFLLKSVANDGQGVTVTVESREPLRQPDIFIEDAASVGFAAPETIIGAHGHSATFHIKLADTLPDGVTLDGMPLTLTIVDGQSALEQHVVVPKFAGAPPTESAPPLSLLVAALFAVLGGFILNLMPCVLPVLSLKMLSVVSHGGGEARTVRHSFLMTAAGILFSYMALGGLTVLLKSLGMAFGWGVQFQQPLFLIFLILLLTFFAANLWGLFEIPLPRFLADTLDKAYHPKLAGDFLAGAFATLLATPCSAPFLGTAVGFALASGARDILIIFFFLGLGMTVPYLAVAAWPRLATSLPKPGAWMVRLRHILGWALAFTAAWLIWILAAQIPWRLAFFAGLCMIGIVLLLALRSRSIAPLLVRIGLTEFIVVALLVTFTGSYFPKEDQNIDRLWLPFNESAIAADIDEGKTVFVDVTADWCLTCKANMRFVLTRDPVAARLFHSSVVAMQADWTNPDPLIREFLQKHGRYGIPFNIVFGPGAKSGLVLPELLSSNAVLEGLDRAGSLTTQ